MSKKSKEKRKKERRTRYVADSNAIYESEREFMATLSREKPDVYAMRVLQMARYREAELAKGTPDRWVLANMTRILHGKDPLPWRGGTVKKGR